MITALLHTAIQAVAPIDGVSIGNVNDKTTWHINFRAEATASQRDAAQLILLAFDVTAPAPRSVLAQALDTAINALPTIDPRVRAVFVEWRKQVS